jgi:hypothetical protein
VQPFTRGFSFYVWKDTTDMKVVNALYFYFQLAFLTFHLNISKRWNNIWYLIEKDINEKLELEVQRKYKNLDENLEKLAKT